MDNFALKVIAVLISFLIIILMMKLMKFIWRNVLLRVILFVKPELKNIYDLLKWFKTQIQSKKIL